MAGLPCRGKNEQNYADDSNYTKGRQFCAFVPQLEGLHRHNGSMGQARPACKGDQTAICRRIADGQQKKNSERGIDSQHHLIRVIGLLRMHHRGDQWIDTGHKEQPYQSQQNLQRAIFRFTETPPQPAVLFSLTREQSQLISSDRAAGGAALLLRDIAR